jgi:uncharacterized damage-inducible protein DinB
MYNSFVTEFLTQHILQMQENLERIKKCLSLLDEEQVWYRPNGVSNTVGNLILHLNGNITQYIISCLGHKPDLRNRNLEFITNGGYDKAYLLKIHRKAVLTAITVIKKLEVHELITVRMVQGFSMSGTAILLHVVEHYSYHLGQIAYLTKLMRNRQIGFYEGKNLNALNEP